MTEPVLSAVVPASSAGEAGSLNRNEYEVILDAVWETVNEKYFDSSFGGKDWQVIGDQYRQKLETVQDGETFFLQVLNPMLFELGVSHLAALPGEMADELEPMTFASASAGMDVRWLDGETVVTRVVEGSPADRARLRPGFVITALDGRTPSEIAAEGLH